MKLIIQNNQVIGTADKNDQNGYLLTDAPTNWDGNLDNLVYDVATNTTIYDLDIFKQKNISDINLAVSNEINALAWRVERAQERDKIAAAGETVQDVLLLRETIRRAGNRAVAAINTATTFDGVKAIKLTITDEDKAISTRITRLEFLQRFTDGEMQVIVTASEKTPSLKTELLKWQTSDGVVLSDPETQSGVKALEIAGLIAAGRAAVILAA